MAEEPPSNTRFNVTIVIIVAFVAIFVYLAISNAYAQEREDQLDRQMLRQIHAKMFGKDDIQMKSFAQDILKLIGKF